MYRIVSSPRVCAGDTTPPTRPNTAHQGRGHWRGAHQLQVQRLHREWPGPGGAGPLRGLPELQGRRARLDLVQRPGQRAQPRAGAAALPGGQPLRHLCGRGRRLRRRPPLVHGLRAPAAQLARALQGRGGAVLERRRRAALLGRRRRRGVGLARGGRRRPCRGAGRGAGALAVLGQPHAGGHRAGAGRLRRHPRQRRPGPGPSGGQPGGGPARAGPPRPAQPPAQPGARPGGPCRVCGGRQRRRVRGQPGGRRPGRRVSRAGGTQPAGGGAGLCGPRRRHAHLRLRGRRGEVLGPAHQAADTGIGDSRQGPRRRLGHPGPAARHAGAGVSGPAAAGREEGDGDAAAGGTGQVPGRAGHAAALGGRAGSPGRQRGGGIRRGRRRLCSGERGQPRPWGRRKSGGSCAGERRRPAGRWSSSAGCRGQRVRRPGGT
uniref:Uncharacterized protein n=1 Tax=Auxenochlorella protothecoides TaxID=3075 RepID=A0A1D2AF25_AUXPR